MAKKKLVFNPITGKFDLITKSLVSSEVTDFTEAAQDATGAAINAGTQDGVSVSYNDAANKIDFTNTDKGSSAVATHVAQADPHTQYLKESDNILINPQVIRVKISNAGFGEFTDLALAVASITDSDPVTKPYVISLGAGVHVANNPIILPAGVSILGEDINATRIIPLDANQHLFVMSNMCEIAFLNLKGITGSIGSGKAAIYCEDVGDFAQLHKLSIYDFDIGIENYANTTTSIVYSEYCDINGNYTYAIKNTGNFTNLSRVQLENFYTYPSTATNAIHCYSSGIGAELIINSAALQGGTDNTGICAENGGQILVSDILIRKFSGTGTGLKNLNIGAGSDIDIGGAQFLDNTNDINILNPSTSISLSATADPAKINVATGATFAALITDSTYGGVVTIGEVEQGKYINKLTPIGTLISKTGTTGTYTNVFISAGVGLSVNVPAGEGFCYNVVDDYMAKVVWSTTTISGLSPNTTYYVYVNSSGVVQAQVANPGLVDAIYLSRIRTSSTGILWTGSAVMNSLHYGNAIELFARNMGAIYISGSVVTENGTRGLNISAGSYQYGTHVLNPSGGTGISFDLFYKNGSGDYTTVLAQTQIDNSTYDNGTGTLASLTSGYYRRDALYTSGQGATEKLFLVKGQTEYSSLVLAEGGDLPIPPDWFSGTICLIASIIQQQGAANFQEIRSEKPSLGFQASGVSAASVHGNLTGLAADDHHQYLLINGTRAMSGALNMGTNAITSVATVNGVTVESHASRHAFNGADPFLSATPQTVGSANTEGIDNTHFSRADHVHAHGNLGGGSTHAAVTTTVNGYMSAADKVKLDAISTTVSAVTASAPLSSSGGLTPNISITRSSTSVDGYLAATDFVTFNNKQNALTFGNLTDVGTDGITVTGGTGAVIGTGVSLSQHVADATHNGYLSSTDWSTFNSKQAAGNYITALTGDGTASGPNSAVFTLATVNATVGSFGTASSVGSFTVNAKGLITAASNTAIQITESQVTNLVTDLAGKQPTGNYITALTGDVTATGPNSVTATISANAVTLAKLAQLPANTIIGNNTGATATPLALTQAQVLAFLGIGGNRNMKAGLISAVTFTGNPKKATVTFATAYPNTNYVINVKGVDARTFSYESKTAAGFVINANANAALTGEVSWHTINTGESIE
jgi:hypothetical protein